jgi:hypothetical protein
LAPPNIVPACSSHIVEPYRVHILSNILIYLKL